ncbi:MAG: branched-chain amino acid ABC transporter permease [Oscillospiraceae bacterium]|nr:branched-chain amino acid ABC transporter permease [Oscillospiraceae bacterium]
MDLTGFLQSLVGGIGTGAIYAMLGLSFTLIFGRLNICSVLHGDLVVLSAYICYLLYTYLHIDPFITMLICMPVFFGIGYLVQSVFMNPFMKLPIWKGRYQGQVMVSWGLGMCIMAMEYILFGGQYKTLNVAYRNATIAVGEIRIPVVHLLALGVMLVMVVGLEIILRRTSLGMKIRACSSDRTTAQLTGINFSKVCAVTFGISTVFAAVSGMFFTLTNQLGPAYGFELTFFGWVAVIIGSMGNLKGAIVAGLLMGIIQSLTSYLWIPGLNQAVLYMALLLILVIRPTGLFGQKEA